jgi:hypothetical protein
MSYLKLYLYHVKIILFCKTASEESRICYREYNNGKASESLLCLDKEIHNVRY